MSYLRNHKLLLLIIAVLLVANISLLWFFVWQKSEGPKPAKKEDIRTKVIRVAGFNEEQTTVYDTLRKKHFDSIRPMFEDLRISRDSLFKLMHRAATPDSLIEIQSAIVYEKQKEIDLKIHRYFKSLIELCNEQQRPQLDSFIQNMAKNMSRGNRRGPGNGDKNGNK